MMNKIRFEISRLKCLLSPLLLIVGLASCVSSAPMPVRPAITYAPFPGGESGSQIVLRREKDGFTFPDDPEAAAFATERNVTLKTAKTCGFDKIVYDQSGPELIFGTGQTADLVHARALMLWCRAYEPKSRLGVVLRVHFETTGDLILSVTSTLEKADGTPLGSTTRTLGGYKMITVVYEAARDVVMPMADNILTGDDVFDIWCKKAPVNSSYWPSTWLREFGQDATFKILGDTSKLYGGMSNVDDCILDRNCELRFTEKFQESSLPATWLGSAISRNDYPRPGVQKGSSLIIKSYARWVIERGQPRLKHFVEYDTLTWGKPCAAKPVPQVNGLSGSDIDAFLKGHTGSDFDVGWDEPDANCRVSRFEMGDHGLSGEGSYSIKLTTAKYGSVRMIASQIFLLNGQTYMKANLEVDKDGHAGYTRGCETTILN